MKERFLKTSLVLVLVSVILVLGFISLMKTELGFASQICLLSLILGCLLLKLSSHRLQTHGTNSDCSINLSSRWPLENHAILSKSANILGGKTPQESLIYKPSLNDLDPDFGLYII